MATYTKTTNFTAKDNLTSGDPAKVIKGSEFDTEFNAIETAVNSKANSNNTVLTGTATVANVDAQSVETDALSINSTAVTATAAEINTLDGITSTTAELNKLDGVTSNIQTQLDGKASSTASPTITLGGDLSGSATLTNLGNATLTATVADDSHNHIISNVDGLQTALDDKAPTASPTFTGTTTIPTVDINGGNIDGVQIGTASPNAGVFSTLNTNSSFEAPNIDDNGTKVDLKNGGATKLATTSTGVDVTGTVTADGFQFDYGDTLSLTSGLTGTDIISTGFISGQGDFLNITPAGSSSANNILFKTANASTYADRMKIHSNGNVEFYEDTGTTAKMVWSSSAESLRVPQSLYDNSVSSYPITGYASIYSTGAGGTAPFNEAGHLVLQSRSSGALRDILFATGNGATERMRIDSSGNVGIGTDSPSEKIEVAGNMLLNASNAELNLQSGVTGTIGAVNWTFNTSSTNYASAKLAYDTRATTGLHIQSLYPITIDSTGQGTKFNILGSEKARLDGSGNLLIGTTDPAVIGNNTKGTVIQGSTGTIFSTAENLYSMILNRKSSDGEIVNFRKDGSPVGSIGVSGGQLTVASESNLVLENDTRILSFGSTALAGAGSGNDAVIDLGTYNRRFKDLYLSGGVYLGGTGSANKLDDYEEGVFTPTLSASGQTVEYTEQFGRYIKVGDLVHVQCRVTIDSVSGGTGSLYFGGLPFTADSGNYYNSVLSVARLANFNTDISSELQNIMIIQGTTYGFLYYSGNTTGNASTLQASGIKAGSTIVYSGTYKAN